MRRTLSAFLAVVFLSASGLLLAVGPSADAVWAALKSRFAGVNDYRADVSLTVTGPSISINDMPMTVYFKKPNKVHVDAAQGMALVPTGNFFGDPVSGFATGAKPVYLRSERKLGRDCHVLKLVGPGGGAGQAAQIWVDKEHSVIVAVETLGSQGIKSSWRYRKIDGKYYLPVEICADICQPSGPNAGKPMRAVLKFSGYRVNKGISDKIFQAKPAK